MLPRLMRMAAAAAVVVMAANSALAQDWPNRPVRVLSPLAAGGAVDVLGRTVGEEFQAITGQPMIIDNRPGAGGTLAGQTAMKAAPDGYTLFLATGGALSISPVLIRNVPYDPLKDFTPLTTAVELPICLVVHKDVPVNNVEEFLAYAKANPGKLSFGSSGPATTHHLAGLYLNQAAGLDIVPVPYKGGAPAMTDLIAGQIPVLFATLSTTIPHMKSGNLKVLGMVEANRSRNYPDIPTIGETLSGYAVPPSYIGYVAPAGMPDALSQQISATLAKAINTPKVRAALEKSGFEVGTSTPEEFRKVLGASLDRFRKIAASAGITPK